MKKINIAMAGGWTWWHVFPIKSLIQHVFSNDDYSNKIAKIVWFGKKNSLEQESCLSLWHSHILKFQPILSGKYRRETYLRSRLKNIADLFKFTYGIIQSLYYLIKNKVDIVFCKWWYVALPVVIAAKILRKKIFVHESDVKSWLVNKIASKFAYKTFTGFDNVLPNSITVGQILSNELISNKSIKNIPHSNDFSSNRELSISEKLYYKDPQKTFLLLMWGSQWSQRLYQKFIDILDSHKDIFSNYEIFVVLWKENQDMKSKFDEYKNVSAFDFVSQKDMWLLLKYCDIALTRAWTTSLAEQKLFDLKIIMVPIPRTHDQYDNAKYYVKHYNDILLDSKDRNYNQNMLEVLKQHVWFKKKQSNKDLTSQINKAKDVILKSFFE